MYDFNRGLTWEKLKQDTDALLNFNHALDIDPGFAEASFQKGLILIKSGDKATAIEFFMNESIHATNQKFRAEVLFQLQYYCL